MYSQLQRTMTVATTGHHLLLAATGTGQLSNGRCVVLLQLQQQQQQQLRRQRLARQSQVIASHCFNKLFQPDFANISKKTVTTTSHTADATLANPTAALGAKLNVSSTSNNAANKVARPTKRPSLPSNMKYRLASHQSTAGHSTLAYDMTLTDTGSVVSQTYSLADAPTAPRPLVLLFAWMLSKDVHIEKYREFWIKRGYDILTVQTSPLDLLFPAIGGRKIALNVFDFLDKIQPRYDEVLVHAFSVGGYQLCEFLFRLSEGLKRNEPEAERLYQSLRGFVVDSCVFADDCAPGLSRAITHHPIVQPIIEASIANFLRLTRPFTLERYYKVSAYIFANERQIPGLMLFSKDDVVSNVQTNFSVVEGWKKNGGKAWAKCWETSAHVLHYKEHPQEYEYEVDRFLTQLNINKAPKPILSSSSSPIA